MVVVGEGAATLTLHNASLTSPDSESFLCAASYSLGLIRYLRSSGRRKMVSICGQFAVLGGLMGLAGGSVAAAAGFLISEGGVLAYAGVFMIVAAVALGAGGGIMAASGPKVLQAIEEGSAVRS
jgi:hypothetical protein